MHVGHHNDRNRLRVQAAGPEAGGDVTAAREPRPGERRHEAAEVLARLRRHRRVKPGVDQHVSGAWVPDQERGAGTVHHDERGDPNPSIRIRSVRPPARSKNAAGACMSPLASGSTVTVAPLVPPRSRAIERLRLGVKPHLWRISRPRPIPCPGGRRGNRLPAGMAERRSRIFAPGLLDGRVCLVSGAGSGLGRATALELASLGAIVVGCGRRPEPLEETAAMIAEGGGSGEAVAADIRDEQAVDELVDGILERHGRLDVLVNNAGGQFLSPAEAISPKGFAPWSSSTSRGRGR